MGLNLRDTIVSCRSTLVRSISPREEKGDRLHELAVKWSGERRS
uniref:Uncharacterized protein n=1 Tax=Arundo donax TaxID=35708 RepID=A0A0A9HV44_ARUDO